MDAYWSFTLPTHCWIRNIALTFGDICSLPVIDTGHRVFQVTQLTLLCLMFPLIMSSQPIVEAHSLSVFEKECCLTNCPLPVLPLQQHDIYLWHHGSSQQCTCDDPYHQVRQIYQGMLPFLDHASQHVGCTPVFTDTVTSDAGVGFGAFLLDISWCGSIPPYNSIFMLSCLPSY